MATSLNLTGLTQGTEYEFRVTALGDGTTYENSAASSTSTFTTLTKLATPSTPQLATTTSSITASWTAVTGATGYTIAYKTSSASNWTTKTTTSTSYAITGLTSGTTYQVKVMATSTNSAYVASEYSTIASAKVQTQLSTPTVTLTSTTNSITASWSSITNATSYTVEYKLSGATSWTTSTQTTTTKTLSSLAEGVTYVFRVKATSSSADYADSAYSTEKSIKTKTTLATPTNLSLTPTTSTIAVSWSAVANASGYTVAYRTGTGSWTTLSSSTTSTTISSLTSGTTYAVKVLAKGAGDYVDSAYSAESSAKVKTKLATPTGLAASNVLSTTATLSWNAVTNADFYLLTISDTNGVISGYNGKKVTTTSQSLTGLTATHQYTVSLTAGSDSTDYVASNATTLDFTTDTKLGTPSAPTLTKTTNSITATWGAVSAADSYKVAYKLSTATQWTEASVTSGTTYTLSSLAEGKTYDFKVQAITTNEAYENSDYSATSSETTLITLSTPANLAVSNITINSATLSWDEVTHASGYKVEYRQVGAANWTTENVEG